MNTANTQTYVIVNRLTDEVIDTDLSAESAAREVLTDDGRAYELRPGELRGKPVMELWVTPRAGWRMERTILWSDATDPDAAWADIARQVVDASWDDAPVVYTAERWAEIAREMAQADKDA